jgi:hypothetical protein
MFKGLINDAKSAAGSLIVKYLARASVAVPFIVALGFATAAITLMLVERFGHTAAYWMVAGGFTAIGIVASLIVTVKEKEEETAEKQAEAQDTSGVASDAAAQAAVQAPIAMLGALLTTPFGPSTVASGAKMVARNLPLVVLLALMALLFWPSKTADETEAAADEPDLGVKPNGPYPHMAAESDRAAA